MASGNDVDLGALTIVPRLSSNAVQQDACEISRLSCFQGNIAS